MKRHAARKSRSGRRLMLLPVAVGALIVAAAVRVPAEAGAVEPVTNTSLAGATDWRSHGAAFWVLEQDQGKNDLNGDGDADDAVLHVLSPDHSVHNVGIAGPGEGAHSDGPGRLVAFLADEQSQGAQDLNGDGDASDEVLHVLTSERDVVNLGVAASTNEPFLRVSDRRVLVAVDETAQGETDLNGDGDADDRVVHYYDRDVGLVNLAVPGSGALLDEGAGLLVNEQHHHGGDLNGDGDAIDMVVHLYTPPTDVTNVGLAVDTGGIVAAGTRRAVLVCEACQGETDLNGDGDTADDVVHVYDVAAGAQNLGLAAGSLRTALDGFVFSVSEAGQGGIDLNGDGDTEDAVVHTQQDGDGVTNLSLAIRVTGGISDGFAFDGGIGFVVSEADQGGTDLNGDGDTGDDVAFVSRGGAATNLGLAHRREIMPVGGGVALRVSERQQGDTDLNGDGDADDDVAHVHYPDAGTRNLGVDGGEFAATGEGFLLVVFEQRQGVDLNRDGDTKDAVLHHFDRSAARSFNLGLAGRGITAWPDGALVEVWEANQGGTDLNGDGDATDAVVHTIRTAPFVPPLGLITGRVTDSSTGDPMGGVCVEVYAADAETRIAATTTESDGVYATPGLAEGSYKVKFFECPPGIHAEQWYDGASDFASADPVEVAAGSVTEAIDAALDIAVQCAGLTPTIFGTSGDDVIRGTERRDVIVGLAGNDVINGGGGRDVICGDAGDDTLRGAAGNDDLRGGSGNDVLVGGRGDDILNGGPGRDQVSFAGSQTGVRVDLAAGTARGQGSDRITRVENLTGSAHDDALFGSSSRNVLAGGSGHDVLNGRNGHDRLVGGDGDDQVAGGAGNDVLKGHGGDDTLVGAGGADTIAAGAGADALYGGGGGDVLKAGGGNDVVYPGSGADDAFGHGGIDVVSYADVARGVTADLGDGIASGAGKDVIEGFEWLEGSPYSDSLTGNGRHNRIFGLAGRDRLNGGNGADLLFGDGGNDTVRGGGGDDTMVGGEGDDALDGGPGVDTASYWDSGSVTVDLSAGTATGDGDDSLSSVEWIVGSPAPDTLTGNGRGNLIEGRAGNDTIRGRAGTDRLVGLVGDDRIFGDAGDDLLYGDEGTDTLDGGRGSDECWDGETHTSCEYMGNTGLAPHQFRDPQPHRWSTRYDPLQALPTFST